MIDLLKNYIDKKGQVLLFGWHKEDLKPLTDIGYRLIFAWDDQNYPKYIIKPQ
jgi:hypothetical protein